MLGAIIAGEHDPERLARLAQGTARKKHPQLVEALRGRITPPHRAMLKLHLGVEYRDLGPAHLDRHDKTKTINRLVKRLRDLGCAVEIPQAA